MLVEVVRRVRDEVPGIAVMARLNVYDAQPYPYGFGMATDGSMEPDLAEPVRLLRQLQQLGLCMVNIGYGNPYYNPHVERPYDTHEVGGYVPDEDPLANVATMVEIQRQLGRELPDLPMVATGLTWLREHGPNVAAGLLAEGSAAMAGFGRMAMAYPDFVADLIKKGEIEPTKTCIACSSCTQIMRDGGRAGCVVRDHEVYAPIFFEGQMHNQAVMRRLAETCRSCAAPTCQTGCPAGVDVPSFVRAIADGDERYAPTSARPRCSARGSASSSGLAAARCPSSCCSATSPHWPASRDGHNYPCPCRRLASVWRSSAPAGQASDARCNCCRMATPSRSLMPATAPVGPPAKSSRGSGWPVTAARAKSPQSSTPSRRIGCSGVAACA